MSETLAAPAVWLTFAPAPARTRTRLRVVVRDDGPMPRAHLIVGTPLGDVDVALAPERLDELAAGVEAARRHVAAAYVATVEVAS